MTNVTKKIHTWETIDSLYAYLVRFIACAENSFAGLSSKIAYQLLDYLACPVKSFDKTTYLSFSFSEDKMQKITIFSLGKTNSSNTKWKTIYGRKLFLF